MLSHEGPDILGIEGKDVIYVDGDFHHGGSCQYQQCAL